MSHIRRYCAEYCPCCVRAGMLLKSSGAAIRKILIDPLADGFSALLELTGCRTVPQIFIGDHHHVDGHDDLSAMDARGDLTALLGTS